MTDSLVHIQLIPRPDAAGSHPAVSHTAFDKPLLKEIQQQLPELVIFDFDNFSEETIRQYALDLLKKGRRAAVLVEVQAEDAPHTGLVSFFNRLLQQKHPQLLMVQQGPLPTQLQKMMKVLGGSNYLQTANSTESKAHILPFLQRP